MPSNHIFHYSYNLYLNFIVLYSQLLKPDNQLNHFIPDFIGYLVYYIWTPPRKSGLTPKTIEVSE